MCMRNIENTPTTLFPLDLTKISDNIKDELFKEQFPIIPDESHTSLTYNQEISSKNSQVFREFNVTQTISILYGSRDNPYLRIDPEIMETELLSNKAKEAYNYICEAIEDTRTEFILEPGQIIAINNHRLAHGRGSFKANYDGRDRWLERILTLEDIRKTVDFRKSEFEPIIVR